MKSIYPEWLENQLSSRVKGLDLNIYTMALEGWRRGLSLTWHTQLDEDVQKQLPSHVDNRKVFSLTSPFDYRTHYFLGSMGDLIKNTNIESPYEKSNVFRLIDKDYCNKLINLFNEQGTDVNSGLYRIYYVDSSIVAVTKIIPLYIYGNGTRSILELIKIKNAERKKNHLLSNKPIVVDEKMKEYLQALGLSLKSILVAGKQLVFPRWTLEQGAELIDITDSFDDALKQKALEEIKLLDHIPHAGLDLFVFQNEIISSKVIINACIGMHLFPTQGKPRNVPSRIIDYYFPETQDKENYQTKLYFSYNEMCSLLNNTSLEQLTTTNVPTGRIHSSRYIVSGKLNNDNYQNWVVKQAAKYNIHGYTRVLKKNQILIVAATNNKKDLNRFRRQCRKGPAFSRVRKFNTLQWDNPIKIGFEVRRPQN